MNFRRKTDYNWTHPQQVEAGACWVHGWVRGGSLSVNATGSVAGVRLQTGGIAQGVILCFHTLWVV